MRAICSQANTRLDNIKYSMPPLLSLKCSSTGCHFIFTSEFSDCLVACCLLSMLSSILSSLCLVLISPYFVYYFPFLCIVQYRSCSHSGCSELRLKHRKCLIETSTNFGAKDGAYLRQILIRCVFCTPLKAVPFSIVQVTVEMRWPMHSRS